MAADPARAPFYVTTPIYYVNDVPHLGHAYTTIVADVLARYHRARGQATRFLTGTDEHGEKIEEVARKVGTSPKEHADRIVERFRETWRNLEITNDDFIRTTEPRHEKVVQALWQRLADHGDIYLGEYEDWYCIACEAFYTEMQLDPGRLCPTHKREVTRVKEKTYFFRMSRYQEALLEHFERHPDFVRPEMRRNEILSFIRSGLRDLSISRTSFKWGIPVPGDPAHVIYVWIDALANYISALGGWGAPLYEQFWPHSVHIIGKDILRFHAVYWPCMLLAAGLPLPRSIIAHGWWTVRGEKISKSMPATRVDPNRIAADLGPDGLRYFLLREVPLGLDGDFVYEALIGRWNSDLANDLGNLVSRTVGMAKGELVPGGADAEMERLAGSVSERVQAHLEAFEPSRALEVIWELVRAANNYIAVKEPFRAPAEARAATLAVVAEAIRWSTLMVAPILPIKAAAILAQLGLSADQTWPTKWSYPGSLPIKAEPVFPKIDDARRAELLARWLPEGAAGAAAPTEPTAPSKPAKPAPSAGAAPVPAAIELADFAKVDLRVAEIRSAKAHPKADKLLALEVDVGEERLRSVVAGIAGAYKPDELVGRRIIFVANLKPAKIRGLLSEGMVLVAGDKEILALSALDRNAPPGTKVR